MKLRRQSLPLSVIVAGTMLLVALLSSSAVLFVGLRVAEQNTEELLAENIRLITDTLTDALAGHLEPVRNYSSAIAEMLDRRPDLLDDWPLLAERFEASMAALPQVRSVAFIAPDARLLRVTQREGPDEVSVLDWSDEPQIRAVVERAAQTQKPFWGQFFYSQPTQNALLNFHRPIWQGGRFRGSLVFVISVDELSRFVASLPNELRNEAHFTAFILYDRDFVLAHSLLHPGFPGLSEEQPLPLLADFPDPVLREIWRSQSEIELEIAGMLPGNVDVHRFEAPGDSYYALTIDIGDYGPVAWTVGLYLPTAQGDVQIERLTLLAYVALGVLLISAALSVLLASLVSRPVRAFAEAAGRVEQLDLNEVKPLPHSLFSEIDRASDSMNSMTGALRIFATYVPQTLVRRLIALRGEGEVASDERRITVMFTDIVGFTSDSEQMSASEVANLLNRHFALLGRCIEETGGTIDKYIGDSVMAIWGAPERQPDMEKRACRAALAIATALEEDNAERRRQGEPEVRIRIGIHSGPALVGNIGFPGRVNYTVVGDTVNSAQRLEGLAKTIAGDDAVKIMVSAETASHLDGDFRLEPVGPLEAKGREAPLEAFQLLGGSTDKTKVAAQ